MDERLRFVARILEGEKMAPLCREFGISRVTGYKIFERDKACGTTLSAAHAPNGLWCADYKGEFLLGNRQYCYPLTITDHRSRDLLACEGLESTKSQFAFSGFERTFRVTRCGRICVGSRKINLSTSLAEQLVGIREVDDPVWQVSFLEYDLGYSIETRTGWSPVPIPSPRTQC